MQVERSIEILCSGTAMPEFVGIQEYKSPEAEFRECLAEVGLGYEYDVVNRALLVQRLRSTQIQG
jgi:hypothetical protein